MISKRINIGLYQIEHNGGTYQIEDIKRASSGDCGAGWILYEMQGDARQYMQDFSTKAAAMNALKTS